MTISAPRLLLVADLDRYPPSLLRRALEAAIEAGIEAVQLRSMGEHELGSWIDFIMGKKPEISLVVPASATPGPEYGWHLKQADSYPKLRPISLSRAIHDPESAAKASKENLDWVLIGTAFRSSCKPGAETHGPEGLARLVELVKPLPALAIGGIDTSTARFALDAGCAGIAVVSAIVEAEDPAAVTAELLALVGESR